MRRLAAPVCLSLALGVALQLRAADPDRDFSGKWILDAAASTAQALPLQNLALQENLLTPLARLGSESSGTSQGTTTQSVPLSQQIIGGAVGGLGLIGALGGLPPGAGMGGILGGLANLGSPSLPSPASLPGGGSGAPWGLTFQNGQWVPTV